MRDTAVQSEAGTSGGLTLASPFDSVEPQAYMERGQRTVGWTLTEPGVLFRNQYLYAWVEVVEQQPWRGEPLRLVATRRFGDGYGRQGFTEPARKGMSELLVPVVARYGFDRLWIETHRRQPAGRYEEAIADALAEAAWWQAKADLGRWHAAGAVDFDPLPPTELGQRPVRQQVVSPYAARRDWVDVSARALAKGEQVGWITRSGDLIPDGSILAAP